MSSLKCSLGHSFTRPSDINGPQLCASWPYSLLSNVLCPISGPLSSFDQKSGAWLTCQGHEISENVGRAATGQYQNFVLLKENSLPFGQMQPCRTQLDQQTVPLNEEKSGCVLGRQNPTCGWRLIRFQTPCVAHKLYGWLRGCVICVWLNGLLSLSLNFK